MANTDSILWGSIYTPETGGDTVQVTRTPNSQLDKNAFLTLLVTQMKYQDPLNPVDDKEFLAQMAQFTALEQMQNMNQTNTKSQAYSMIGKNIVAHVYNSASYTLEEVEGLVTSVIIKNGEPYLCVNDRDIAVSDVTYVYDTYQSQSIYQALATTQNMALIGKYVQAVTVELVDGEYKPKAFVEGKVDSVKFTNGQTILMVGTKEVFAQEIIAVGEDDMMLLGKDITYMTKSGGEYSEAHGEIADVKFSGGDTFLVVNGKEIKIDKLTYISEGFKYIGQNVKQGSVSGTVKAVVIKEGITYLKVGEDEELVVFSKVRGS